MRKRDKQTRLMRSRQRADSVETSQLRRTTCYTRENGQTTTEACCIIAHLRENLQSKLILLLRVSKISETFRRMWINKYSLQRVLGGKLRVGTEGGKLRY